VLIIWIVTPIEACHQKPQNGSTTLYRTPVQKFVELAASLIVQANDLAIEHGVLYAQPG
jgi:hypothetical protein